MSIGRLWTSSARGKRVGWGCWHWERGPPQLGPDDGTPTAAGPADSLLLFDNCKNEVNFIPGATLLRERSIETTLSFPDAKERNLDTVLGAQYCSIKSKGRLLKCVIRTHRVPLIDPPAITRSDDSDRIY